MGARQASRPWGCNTAKLVTNLHKHSCWQAMWNHSLAFAVPVSALAGSKLTLCGHVPCDVSQVFHMERSSNSLLNLQNTLPLFR